jgi:hypothetical protein
MAMVIDHGHGQNHVFVSFLAVCWPFRRILGHMTYIWATFGMFGNFRLYALFCAESSHFSRQNE